MSDAAQPSYTVAENLRWFAVVYLVALILISFAVNLLRTTAGVNLPSSGIGIGLFVGIVYAAGARFAGRRGFEWTGRDRHNLALGYVLVSILVSSALMALVFVIEPASLSVLSGMGGMAAILVGVVLVIALLYYGAARFILKLIARRGGQQ